MLNRLITVGLNAIFWLLAANLLEPKDYGEIGFLIALAGLFYLISGFGASQSIVVFRAKKDETADAINLLMLISTSSASLLLILFSKEAALFCLGYSFFVLIQVNLLGLKKYKAFFYNGLIKGSLTISLPFLFYFFLDTTGLIAGLAFANLLSVGYYIKSLKFSQVYFYKIKENFKVLLNNFAAELSNGLPRVVDKVLIAPLFGLFIIGIYQLNSQILFGLEVFPLALQLYLLSEESSGVRHRKLIKYFITIICLITIVAILFVPYVINELFQNYREGIVSLQILLVSLIPLSISYVFQSKLQARKSTTIGYSLVIRIGSLAILIIVLGNYLGLVGLSLAFLISTILNSLYLYSIYRKLNKSY